MTKAYELEIGRDTRTSPISLGAAPKALKELAGFAPGYGYTATAIDEAAKASGLSRSRVFDLWYRKARTIAPEEGEAIVEALERKRQREARNELHELRVRLARLEASMAASDASFHRPQIDAAREVGFGLSGALAPRRR